MKTRVIFVRHAEAEGNLYRIFHGWTDSGITEKGHIQAQKAAESLRNVKIDVIYSSSLKRTIQTAQYIACIKGLPIIRTDKLKEINGGDWEGKKWDDLPEIWPEEYNTWENTPHIHRMPNGETMEEFQERLKNEVTYIINNNEGKNICIVTHGTAIRALMCHFFYCNLEGMANIKWYDNTSISIIDYENGRFHVVKEGDATHLDKELSTIQNQKWWNDHMEKYDNATELEE